MALAAFALAGCERASTDHSAKTIAQKAEPGCEGVPALNFDSGFADPDNFLQGGYEERVRGAQGKFILAHKDRSISVVILPGLNGRDIEATATCIANGWEAEKLITANDIVIVLAPNDRRVRIATGADARDDFPDAEAAKIIDKMTPIFAREDPDQAKFSEGLSTGIEAISEYLKDRP
ncbi:MAG: TPM domain-containing protein [Sphingopyxis sp.]|nr:TPM domain-containing protein [Sphingopyxis sp.]